MKIYFAAPLFSEMELSYNEKLAGQIRERYPEVDLFVPQEASDINDKTGFADSKMIAEYDTKEVLSSDLIVAILDGIVIDPGVASEIGVAYQAGIPVIGLYSDSRQEGADNPDKLEALKELAESQFSYANLYTIGLIKLNGEVVASSKELIDAIEKYKK